MKRAQTKPGAARLIGIAILMMFLWGYVFPSLTRIPSVQSRIDRYSKAGINPAAVFYTDHPGINEIEFRVSQRLNERSSDNEDSVQVEELVEVRKHSTKGL